VRIYRWALPLLLLAGFVICGLVADYQAKHPTVHFVNDLPISVTVTAGAERIDLAPNSRQELILPAGPCHIVVTAAEGRVLDEQDVDIPAGHDLVAYNVLGAAPLALVEVIYVSDRYRSGPDPEGRDEHFCGRHFITRRDVRYVFTEPPKQIDMPEGKRTVSRYYFYKLDGDWSLSLQILDREGKHERVTRLARSVALADPGDELNALAAVGYVDKHRGHGAAVDLIGKLLQLTPQAVELHRVRQELMRAADRQDECRRFYRDWARREPSSPLAGYLHARVLPNAEAADLWPALHAKHPEDLYIVRAYGWNLNLSRQFERAAELLDKPARAWLAKPAPAGARLLAEMGLYEVYATAMLGAGRTAEAVRWIAEVCDARPEAVDMDWAVLFGRACRLAPAAMPSRKPEHHLRKAFGPKNPPPATRLWFALSVGHRAVSGPEIARIKEAPARKALQIMRAARKNIAEALRLSTNVGEDVLRQMDDITLLMLACEHGRRGRKRLVEKLVETTSVGLADRAATRQFALTGQRAPSLAEIELQHQAVLHFALGRRAQAAGRSPEEHFRKARADDLLKTLVSEAIDHWPSARPGR
jgi:hypothetical protein